MKSVGTFLQAEEDLKEEVERQKNNPFAKVWGKEANDFEAFLELEKIRERRAEIESYMRLYSPPGTFERWVRYQAEARKSRKAAQEARIRMRRERNELMLAIIVVGGAVGGALYGLYILGRSRDVW